jgi:hypothetical protein
MPARAAGRRLDRLVEKRASGGLRPSPQGRASLLGRVLELVRRPEGPLTERECYDRIYAPCGRTVGR